MQRKLHAFSASTSSQLPRHDIPLLTHIYSFPEQHPAWHSALPVVSSSFQPITANLNGKDRGEGLRLLGAPVPMGASGRAQH